MGKLVFIKSDTEILSVDSSDLSHIDYDSSGVVSLFFEMYQAGQLGTIEVKLAVTAGFEKEAVDDIGAIVRTSRAATFSNQTRKSTQLTTSGTRITIPTVQASKYVTSVLSIIYTEGGPGDIPSGGTDGQVLTKASDTDYDVGWEDVHTLLVDVRNTSGGTLAKGTPVHATGVTGTTADVIAARADTPSAMPATYVLDEELADGAIGNAIVIGQITGVDTSSFSPGDVIYVAATGGFTNVKPTGTNLIQNLGVVTKSNVNTGSGVVLGAGRANDVPNIATGNIWAGNADGVATATDTAYIDIANSRVGIGTSSPSEKLTVSGNISVSGDVYSDGSIHADEIKSRTYPNYNILNLEDDNVLNSNGVSLLSVSSMVFGLDANANSGADQFQWIADGATANTGSTLMVLTDEGELGIGTASPSAMLDVVGLVNFNDGSNNVMISSGNTASTFSNTTAVGYEALTALTTGVNNTVIGYQAGHDITTAGYNTAVGFQALANTTTNGYNTAIGVYALQDNTASNAVAVGYGALQENTTGASNTGVGYRALASNLTGGNNTAVGNIAGVNITGGNNTVMGFSAGSDITGGSNTAIGWRAGEDVGSDNTMVGREAGRFTNGSNNVAIGNYAAEGVEATSTFSNTVAIGYSALVALTTGAQNTAVGYQAGYSLTTGSYNVMLGYKAGYNETGSNKLYIANSDTTTPLIYGEFDNDLIKINGSFEVTGGTKIEKTSNTDYDYRGDVVYFGATTSMTQGDLYYFNSSGNWAQANASTAAGSGSVLLAIALGTASDTDGMLLRGTFTMEASAIDGTEATGDELYISTTAGHVTSDVSAYTTGNVVRVVGYCLDGTNGQIWFNPSNDFITLA